MRVIFLDIDGVLNYQGSNFIDKECFNNLKHIVDETDAKIVIISTCRVCMDDEYMQRYVKSPNSNLIEYRELFLNTFSGKMRWIDIAPDFNEQRSKEIDYWLNQHPEVKSFVIIDDFNVEYDKNYPNNWVKPSYYREGLSRQLANEAIKILTK